MTRITRISNNSIKDFTDKWSPKNKLDTLKNPTRNIRCTESLDKCYALGNLSIKYVMS